MARGNLLYRRESPAQFSVTTWQRDWGVCQGGSGGGDIYTYGWFALLLSEPKQPSLQSNHPLIKKQTNKQLILKPKLKCLQKLRDMTWTSGDSDELENAIFFKGTDQSAPANHDHYRMQAKDREILSFHEKLRIQIFVNSLDLKKCQHLLQKK